MTTTTLSGSNVMDTSTTTAAVFAAYLKCPTKAYLLARGEKSQDTVFSDTLERISDAFKARASYNLRAGSNGGTPIDFSQLGCGLARGAGIFYVDCQTASYDCDQQVSLRAGRRVKSSSPNCQYVPILYSAWDKIDQSDDLLVCLGALAIGQATGTEIPASGRVIYGEGLRRKTVRAADHLPKARSVAEKISSVCRAMEPPPIILNKHCQRATSNLGAAPWRSNGMTSAC